MSGVQMPLLDNINRFVMLFIDTFRRVGRWRAWLLLLGYFLVNWLILYAHYNFLSPVFYSVMTAWTRLIDPGSATAFTHYPAQFYYLADYFGWAKLIVGLVLEGLVLGGVVRILSRDNAAFETQKSLLVLWPHLVLAWLVINVLTLAAGLYLPELMRPLLDGPRRLMAFRLVFMPGIYSLILALFFFAIPAIALKGDNVFRGLMRALTIFRRNPVTCLLLSGIILAGPITLSILSGYASDIIEKFRPELIYWLLVIGLGTELLANFFWMGTASRFLADHSS
jgi:hypothetical protein